MTDELRQQLSKLDPMHPGVPTEPATTPSSRQRLERIMSLDTAPRHAVDEGSPNRRLSTRVAAAIAVAAVAIGGIAFATTNRGADPGTLAGPPLELSLGASDSLASCIMFDVAILADMPLAFEGTVTAVDGKVVTLAVDHWYTSGDAAEVTLAAPAGFEALIGGISFVEGSSYLITATDGSVNYCGYSDLATPELRAAFDQAFGA